MTLCVAKHYAQIFSLQELKHRVLSLDALGIIDFSSDTYNNPGTDFKLLEDQYLKPAEKFLFILPEYNGIFPGVLKLLLDMSDITSCWSNKKAAITGISDGRAGCLRGIDTLTNCLHYLNMEVMPYKLPISQINNIIGDDCTIRDAHTAMAIEKQIQEFIKF